MILSPDIWGTLVSTVTPKERAWINGFAPPHGYLWKANGIGQLGVAPGDITNSTIPVANGQIYIYMCNSSFNPSTDVNGVIDCGGNILETYREDFTSSDGNWTTLDTGVYNPTVTTSSEGLRIQHPLGITGAMQHTLTGEHLTKFYGNTYTHVTMRIKNQGVWPGGPAPWQGNRWWGALLWQYEGGGLISTPFVTADPLTSYIGTGANSQHAFLTRTGTTYSPTINNDYDHMWNPFEDFYSNTYIDLTWDLSGHPNWGSTQTNRVINAISIWTWSPVTGSMPWASSAGANNQLMDYTIDAISIHNGNNSTGGGFQGPNNCTWTGIPSDGMWVQSAYNTVLNNAPYTTNGASDWTGLTANQYTNNAFDAADSFFANSTAELEKVLV